MKHEELLAKIGNPIDEGYQYGDIVFNKALRAVVDLHKANPEPKDSPFKDHCRACGKAYPCRTIQAIEKELS